jgi:hypothetical protein
LNWNGCNHMAEMTISDACWHRTDEESGYMRYTEIEDILRYRYKTSKTGCLQWGNSEYVVQRFGTAWLLTWKSSLCRISCNLRSSKFL